MSCDPFIIDYGPDFAGEINGVQLERYAAWVFDVCRGKPQVKECSNDLGTLQQRYPGAQVIQLEALAPKHMKERSK